MFDFHKYVTVTSAGVFTRPVVDPNGAATLLRSVMGRRIVFLKIGAPGYAGDLNRDLSCISWKAVVMFPGDHLYVIHAKTQTTFDLV